VQFLGIRKPQALVEGKSLGERVIEALAEFGTFASKSATAATTTAVSARKPTSELDFGKRRVGCCQHWANVCQSHTRDPGCSTGGNDIRHNGWTTALRVCELEEVIFLLPPRPDIRSISSPAASTLKTL
jgi:hypothetical protein